MSNLKDFFDLVKQDYADSNLFKDLSLINNISSHIPIGINFLNNTEMLEKIIKDYDKLKFPSITCGLLTYNEERSIKRCLASVIDEFDEIVVLDSVSKDRTIEIIKDNFEDVQLHIEPWVNDFSFHRNKIISIASSDWIYFIDADNYYDSKNRGKAKRVAKVIDYLGIQGVVSPTIIEHDESLSQDTRRMFRLKDNILFSGKVHEEPVYTDGTIPRNISVDINVFHDGYNPKIINMMKKNERNITLTKEMIKSDPDNPKWLYFYARELYQTQGDILLIKSTLFKALELYKDSSYKRYYVETVSLLCRVLFETKDFTGLNDYLKVLDNITSNCSDIDYYNSMLLFFNLQLKIRKLSNSLKVIINDYEKNYHSFISPFHDHLKVSVVNMFLSLGDYQSAYEVYKKIKSEEIRNEFLNNLTHLKEQFLIFMDNVNKEN